MTNAIDFESWLSLCSSGGSLLWVPEKIATLLTEMSLISDLCVFFLI